MRSEYSIKKGFYIFLMAVIIIMAAGCSQLTGSDKGEPDGGVSPLLLECREKGGSFRLSLTEEEAGDLESLTAYLLYEDPDKKGNYYCALSRTYDHPDPADSLDLARETKVLSVMDPESGTRKILDEVIKENEDSFVCSHIFLSETPEGIYNDADTLNVKLAMKRERKEKENPDSTAEELSWSFSQANYGGIDPAAFSHYTKKGQGFFNTSRKREVCYDNEKGLFPYDSWSYYVISKIIRYPSLTDGPAFYLEDLDHFDFHFVMQIKASFSDGSSKATRLLDLNRRKTTKAESTVTTVDTQGGQFDFEIRDGKAVLTDYKGTDQKITIPEKVDGADVVSIESYSFSNLTELKTLVLPSTISSLSGNAFSGCKQFSRIEFSGKNDNYMIRDNLLMSRDGKKVILAPPATSGNLTLPAGVEEIAPFAFLDCKKLVRVSFPEGLKKIGHRAFFATALKEINLPDSLQSIGANAFSDYSILSSYLYDYDNTQPPLPRITLKLGRNLEWIGENAFNGYCIEEYRVDEKNSCYCDYEGMLFNKDRTFLLACPCIMHGELRLPDGLKNMSPTALSTTGMLDDRIQNRNPLTQMILPDSLQYFPLESLPSYMETLRGGKNIKEWSRPNLLHEVSLADAGGVSCFKIIDGVYYSADGSQLLLYPDSLAQEQFTLPGHVRTVNATAFHSNPKLKEITLSKDFVPKGMEVYEFGELLASIHGIERISVEEGNPAFYSEGGMLFDKKSRFLLACPEKYADSTLEIPEGTTGICQLALPYSLKLDSITLPSTLKYCNHPLDYAYFFDLADKVDEISVSEDNPYIEIKTGVLISRPEEKALYVIEDQVSERMDLPSYVKTIPGECFRLEFWSARPESIHFAEGLKKIEDGNFNNITKKDPWDLTDVYLPESLEKISKDSFCDSPGIRLAVKKGSYAEAFAKKHNLEYINYSDQ